MNISKRIKKFFIAIVSLYFINNFFMPMMTYLNNDYRYDNKKIIEVCSTDDLKIKYVGSENEKIYRYLNLASLLASRYLKYSEEITGSLEERANNSAKSRLGNCVDYSTYTYTNFLYLIKNTGNTNLIDRVRIVSGYMYVDNKYDGHQWLEFSHNNEWAILDPTNNDFEINEKQFLNEIKANNFMTSLDSLNFNVDTNKYYPLMYHHVDSVGILSQELNWKNVLLDSRGLIYLEFFD